MKGVLRFCSSLALLLLLAWWLDAAQVVTRLGELRASWVLAALVLSIVQVIVSAWRWRFTAGRLGVVLSLEEAVREYYRSMFLNQVLPGGVLGDVSRAWRHASAQRHVDGASGPAVRAVVLERMSGQIVMMAIAAASVASLLSGSGGVVWGLALTAGLLMVFSWRWWIPSPGSSAGSLAGRLWQDTKVALFARDALPIQIASSAVVVATYVATYVLAAAAVGVDTPLRTLLPLVAPVLVSMLIPVSVAGWGLREAAAALLWGVAGLTSEEGVVISITYGLLVLVSSLPGSLVLVRGSR